MAITNLYKTLFKLNFFHHYFLDEGEEVFDPNNGTPPKWQVTNLREYSILDYFDIVPSEKTKKLLKNWKAIYKLQNDGIEVGIKVMPTTPPKTPFIPFSDDFIMDFIITVKDKYFENYTDIVWEKDRLVMISNQEPALLVPPLALGDPRPVKVAFNFLSAFQTQIPGAPMTIDLDKDINPRELIGKFGFIRMHLLGDGTEIDLRDGANLIAVTPRPMLMLKNRETYWYYFSNKDGALLYPITSPPHPDPDLIRPLTQNGFIEVKRIGHGSDPDVEFPNPDAKLIVPDDPTPTKYYSESYI
jgi:hypothetical protein